MEHMSPFEACCSSPAISLFAVQHMFCASVWVGMAVVVATLVLLGSTTFAGFGKNKIHYISFEFL